MRCVRGERLSGDNVQQAIIDLIRRAAVVIADVSDDHRNTLIEAGIAMGCGTRLKLMCREPPAGAPLKKRFMFEGQEFFWYRTARGTVGSVLLLRAAVSPPRLCRRAERATTPHR